MAGTVRKLAALNDLKARYGDRFWLAPLDVTDAPAIRRVVDEAFTVFGRIDVIVNNAGYALLGAAAESPTSRSPTSSRPTCSAPFQVVRATLPHQRVQGGGRVLIGPLGRCLSKDG